MSLTYEELHKQLMYNPWTGYFYWKINKRRIKKENRAGWINSDGYIQIAIHKETYYAHVLAWFYVEGYFPENDIDHKDRIKYNNWISNLRVASRQCNVRNQGNIKSNTSGVKGVSWYKQRDCWMSYIYINGKMRNLGYYKNFNNAVCARLAGEQCVEWEGCDSCSPAFKYVKENIQ